MQEAFQEVKRKPPGFKWIFLFGFLLKVDILKKFEKCSNYQKRPLWKERIISSSSSLSVKIGLRYYSKAIETFEFKHGGIKLEFLDSIQAISTVNNKFKFAFIGLILGDTENGPYSQMIK
ncbi:7779_t:CDS:2 [Funneliformis mosseae]|uniref:7779_t:CDS:1 n=1 Tax=Funneliformis mosseae TaxID=27381 RepID=A0A9N9CVZ6_FUNMO|nr:7779_t:CDS:2 [Funneliformis mosseae]